MTNSKPYIVRQQEKNLLSEVAKGLDTPEGHPVLFYIWGIGGVGKSTLLRTLEETHKQQANFSKVSFGTVDETPLTVMDKLYKELPELGLFQKDVRDIIRNSDPFPETYSTFRNTLTALETKPIDGKAEVDKEQIDQVRRISKLVANGAVLGTQTLTTGSMSLLAASTTTATVNKAVDVAVDGAVTALSLKDSLLLKHSTTKQNPKLQELMETPLPKLTDAFVESLMRRAKHKPIVLILDTYEKATAEVDSWLHQILLSNKNLKTSRIRIVIAGRYRLSKKDGWKELTAGQNLIHEVSLKEFEKEQTKKYLEQIDVSERRDIDLLYKATKGLPFHLDLIRQEKQDGEPINYSEEIAERLLKGLSKNQRQLVQLAACCRWFDQALIQRLAIEQGLDFQSGADANLNCFEWLKQFDIVEYVKNDKGWYCLKDVAREAIRRSLYQLDHGRRFREIHSLLQRYFEEQANQEVPPDCPAPEQYENLDWCRYTAEAIYYALFALRREECKRYFLTHFFASRHFEQIGIVMTPFAAIAAEAEISDNGLLPNETQKFLQSIQLLFPLGWLMVTLSPSSKIKLGEKIVPKSLIDQIESALSMCLAQVESWEDGLAKFVGLMCKFLRCHPSQEVELLQQAKRQAELLESAAFPEFSGSLFSNVGNAFLTVNQYEEAIASCDKAIQIKPDFYLAWVNRGVALDELERYKEAIASCDKAIQIKPDFHLAWFSRGAALAKLERYEEAIASCDKAIQIKPDFHPAWLNRGVAQTRLKEYENALRSFDEALKLAPNESQHKINRGVLLAWAGQHKAAIEACDSVLKASPNNVNALYGKACCYALQDNVEEAIKYLGFAIAQKSDDCRRRARKDPEFASIRDYSRFQALIHS